MSFEIGQIIRVGPGTELNTGTHEDSDFYVVDPPGADLYITGVQAHGAVPVHIVEDGRKIE